MEKRILCVYYSVGGSSLEYAMYLQEEYGIEICDVRDVRFKYLDCDILIFISPIYANKIAKMKLLIKNSKYLQNTKVFILGVGISKEDSNYCEELYHINLENTILKDSKLYFMRGCLDINTLPFFKRAIVKRLYMSLLKKKERTDGENELMYDIYYGTNYCSNYYLIKPMEEIKEYLK